MGNSQRGRVNTALPWAEIQNKKFEFSVGRQHTEK